jgi:hypothetical protein
MIYPGLLTILATAGVAGLLAYRTAYFHKRTLWRLSLQQILLLVIAPGILFPVAFNYLQAMVAMPTQTTPLISDRIVVTMTLLAMLFTYGGLAIHAVTKMLAEYLRNETSEAAQINKYFHLQFSHNLTFAGSLLVLLGFTLLELNHAPTQSSSSLVASMFKGGVLGGCFVLAMSNYTRFMGDTYFGKWNDLKLVFVVGWLGFMVLLYGVMRLDSAMTEYQFLLPTLISFAVTTVMSLFLVVRRLKRGGFRLGWRVYD